MINKKRIEVVAAVIKKDHMFFIAQRPNKGELALKWEFPGGKIEYGETKEQALIREIYEEFDTKISVDKFLKTIEYEYQTFVIILHCYLCSIEDGSMILIEHKNKQWVTLEGLKEYDLAAADKELLSYLVS